VAIPVIQSVQHARVEPQSLDWPAVPGLVGYRVGNRVGESPVWDATQRCLGWIDVRAPQVLRLDPETHTVSRWTLSETVGAVGLLADGQLTLALRHRLVAFDPRFGTERTIADANRGGRTIASTMARPRREVDGFAWVRWTTVQRANNLPVLSIALVSIGVSCASGMGSW